MDSDLTTAKLRVGLVEDHDMVLDGLVALLSADERFQIAGAAQSVEEFRGLHRHWRAGLIIADYRLPDGKGTELPTLTKVPVLIISGLEGPLAFDDALRSGCAGFVSKSSNVDRLADTALVVADGGAVFPRDIPHRSDRASEHAMQAPLTAREAEILRMLAQARTVQGISTELVVSQHTVRNHVRSILSKLEAKSQLEAVVHAVQAGIVDIDH